MINVYLKEKYEIMSELRDWELRKVKSGCGSVGCAIYLQQ